MTLRGEHSLARPGLADVNDLVPDRIEAPPSGGLRIGQQRLVFCA